MSADLRPTVLILGATAGGIATATELARLDRRKSALNIILIDHETHPSTHTKRHQHIAQTRIDQSILPHQVAKQHNVQFVHDLITDIYPHEQVVGLHNNGKAAYDYLVVALDSQPKKQHVPGLREYAHSTYTRYDTARLKKELIRLSKNGTSQPKIVIGGAGPTGLELADILSRQHLYCKSCPKKELHWQITLIEQGSTILSGFSLEDQIKACQHLDRQGVELYLNTTIERITNNRIYYLGGQSSEYDLFIWAGGKQPHQQLARSRFVLHDNGRISVNPYLQARGYSRIYAVGESAHPTDIHPTALSHHQAAMDQAKTAAYNLHQQIYELPLKPHISARYPLNFRFGPHMLKG